MHFFHWFSILNSVKLYGPPFNTGVSIRQMFVCLFVIQEATMQLRYRSRYLYNVAQTIKVIS